MNEFFYESRGKAKLKDLMEEGMRSQAFHRSGSPKLGLLPDLSKFVLAVLGTLSILALLVR